MGLVMAIAMLAPGPAAFPADTVRGKRLIEFEATFHPLGKLCSAPSGSIYLERSTGTQVELIRLDASGKLRWRQPLMPYPTMGSSQFASCTDDGVVYIVHRSGTTAKDADRRIVAVSLTADGQQRWVRELSVPTCDTQIDSATVDVDGRPILGGSIKQCDGQQGQLGFVAWLGPDGALMSRFVIPSLLDVRSVTRVGSSVVATGLTPYTYRVVSISVDGKPEWTRAAEDLKVRGELRDVAALGEAIYVCATDYDARQVQVVRLDRQGNWVAGWSFGNRTPASSDTCLVQDPQHTSVGVLMREQGGGRLEMVRIDTRGVPLAPTQFVDNIGFARGYAVTPGARALLVSGSRKGTGDQPTQILTFDLPSAQAAGATGACLTPALASQAQQWQAESEQAQRAADAPLQHRVEGVLEARSWTGVQKAASRERIPKALFQVTHGSRTMGEQDIANSLREQLATATLEDCQLIIDRLRQQHALLKRLAEQQLQQIDTLVRDAVILASPPDVPLPPEDIAAVQREWAQLISRHIGQRWLRPPGLPSGLRCTLDLELATNGSITSIAMKSPSGNADFDESVLMAVRKSSPLPLPLHVGGFVPKLLPTFSPESLSP